MGKVKGYVRDHNRQVTLTEVERLVNEGFSCMTVRWKKLVNHVEEEVEEKVEDHYWEHDGLYKTMIDKFIIHTEDSSDYLSSTWDGFSSESSSSEGE